MFQSWNIWNISKPALHYFNCKLPEDFYRPKKYLHKKHCLFLWRSQSQPTKRIISKLIVLVDVSLRIEQNGFCSFRLLAIIESVSVPQRAPEPCHSRATNFGQQLRSVENWFAIEWANENISRFYLLKCESWNQSTRNALHQSPAGNRHHIETSER